MLGLVLQPPARKRALVARLPLLRTGWQGWRECGSMRGGRGQAAGNDETKAVRVHGARRGPCGASKGQ